jgi:hypothetical protein
MGQYASKPGPAFTKLAVMLRNIPAVQFVFAKFAALLRSGRARGEPLISEFLDEAPSITRNTVDQHAAVLKPSSDHAIAAPDTNDQSEREKLSPTLVRDWDQNVEPRCSRCRTCSAKYSRTVRVAAAEAR